MRNSPEKQYVVEWDEINGIVKTKNLDCFNRVQLKQMYNEIIEVGTKHGCTRVFNDARQFVTVCFEDQQWVKEDWYPRFNKAGFKKSAIILPSNMIQRQMLERMMHDRENAADENYPVEVKCFTSPEAGMDWLLC